MRHNASIDLLLEAMIGDVLKQIDDLSNNSSSEKNPPRFTHNVLRLFIFPPLEAILCTMQKKKFFDLTKLKAQKKTLLNIDPDIVENTFICNFYDAVCVQTDFNAQVGFLPELLKSYITQVSYFYLIL